MANTAVKVSATPNRITYILTGDGTQVGPTIPNATLLADMVAGPLRDSWNAAVQGGTQAAMRSALLGGLKTPPANTICRAELQLVTAVADTTAQINQASVDVDVDAVTATKAEINIGMSDTTGTLAYLHLICTPANVS